MHEDKTARMAQEQQSSASIALLGHYDLLYMSPLHR
jgi:hypothetical protein